MARFIVKKGYRKDKDNVYCNEIGPCAQNISTILGPIVYTTDEVYVITFR
jgi:hypothetical protein